MKSQHPRTHSTVGKRLLLAALLAITAGCGQDAQTTATTTKKSAAEPLIVNIGVAGPLTGPQSAFGVDLRNGAQLAVDDLNASEPRFGGRPARFELATADDEGDAEKAVGAARTLVDAKVAAVVGHVNSGTTIAAAPVYAAAGIPQISPASNPRYTQLGHKTAFRIAANDDQQGVILAKFALETGAKSFVVIDNATPYGKGLADIFEATVRTQGGRILGRLQITDPARDLAPAVARIKTLKPGLVLFGGFDAEAAALLKQLAAQGVKTRLLSGDGVQTGNFIQLAGAAAAGVAASATGRPLDQTPDGQAFLGRYRQRFGADPVLQAAHAYDGVMVIAAAMRRAGSTDPARFSPDLAATQHNGLVASVAFDAHGDLREVPITLYAVSDGRWVPIQTLLATSAR
jgi:branched-chain amino acid transport system substrate-binding protein